MASNMICIQTSLLAFFACLVIVGSLEQYEDQSRQPSPIEVQSTYINKLIKDSLLRQKRQSRSFFSNKLNGVRNISPNAINDNKYSGNADFAFPGEIYRPNNYPIDDGENYNNQFGQERPNSDLIQGTSQNPFQNPQTNNAGQNNWLNPNFNSEGRNPNWWGNQNSWNSQENSNQDFDSNNTPAPNNIPSSPNACQLQCRRFVTGEYNPICGSDGVTYLNPGRFSCAVKCGKQITGKSDRTCGSRAPVA